MSTFQLASIFASIFSIPTLKVIKKFQANKTGLIIFHSGAVNRKIRVGNGCPSSFVHGGLVDGDSQSPPTLRNPSVVFTFITLVQ